MKKRYLPIRTLTVILLLTAIALPLFACGRENPAPVTTLSAEPTLIPVTSSGIITAPGGTYYTSSPDAGSLTLPPASYSSSSTEPQAPLTETTAGTPPTPVTATTTAQTATEPRATETDRTTAPQVPEVPHIVSIPAHPEKLSINVKPELDSFSVTAPYYAIYDLSTDTLICSTDLDKKTYPASTTKILVTLFTLSFCSPSDVITVGNEVKMIASDSSKAGIKPGEVFTLEQLLYCLLLPSGNDAAYAIATYAGRRLYGNKSLDEKSAMDLFMEGVNIYGSELGLTGTHFITPDGYHDDNHYTTLHDILIMTKAALSQPVFSKVVSTLSIKFTNQSGKKYDLTNTNFILDPSQPSYVPGAAGVKTGYTSKAGACLVAAAERDGKKVIALAFGGSSKSARFTDAQKMLEFALAK